MHILAGCISTSKPIIKRHNSTSLLLRKLLQTSNGGRWLIVRIDLSEKPTMDFTNLKPDVEVTTTPQIPQILLPEAEGLQNDKPNIPNNPYTIP